jgi:iron complex outermembrane receptor protein
MSPAFRGPWWRRAGLGLALASLALAAGEEPGQDLQQMSLEEILKVKLTVATRTETTVDEAPSVVSVITAEDIRRMGARDLRDVIRTVPGFELGVRNLGYTEFGLRGIMTDNTEKIRILLDGLPVNEDLEGSGTVIFGDFALDNVERIEIIRGPGSALYGTNAFLGVISIITKAPPASGNELTVTAKGGSFDTREGSVLVGRSGESVRFSAFLHYLDTDGPRSPIAQDALQTQAEAPYYSGLNSGISLAGTSAGHTDEFDKKFTAQFKLDIGTFFFRGILVDARRGPYLGADWAVNTDSEAHPSQIIGEAGWTLHPTGSLVLEPKVYALRYDVDNLWNSAPDGYRIPNGGGTIDYTQGLYDRNAATQDVRGGEVKATWNPAASHQVLLGATAERQRLFSLTDTANVPGFGPEDMLPATSSMRVAPKRDLTSAYLQDQWTLAHALGLTAGLRMDRYSDAGTKVSPRLALVWGASPELTLKAMYGQAFRAPTFVESYLYAQGGLIAGNENNRSETISTSELEASYRFGTRAVWRVVLFQNRIKDLIQLLSVPGGGLEYLNTPGTTEVSGIETEVSLVFTPALHGYVNCSGQSGRNQATGAALTGMAGGRGNAGLDWMATDRLDLNGSLNVVGPRQRAAGDPRPALGGYSVVDLAVTDTVAPGLDLSFTAHNLLDADQRYPDPYGYVPGDFPGEGRNLQAGIRYKF